MASAISIELMYIIRNQEIYSRDLSQVVNIRSKIPCLSVGVVELIKHFSRYRS